MTKNEIQALISLLDDPDHGVLDLVRGKLLSLGQDVIPDLESAWESAFGTLQQNRIEELIHNIQFEKIKIDLTKWVNSKDNNLVDGSVIIARYQYPDIDLAKITAIVEQIKQDVWLELNPGLTAMETVKVFNHILFEVHGFSGNTGNFHAPQNSFINNVLESKKGNPISLSILYIEIARRLNIPIYGVNLPQHFILAYLDKPGFFPFPSNTEEQDVLFYINPFSRGAIFSRKDVDAYLRQLNLAPIMSFYNPCNAVEIIRRVINNLMNSFEKLGSPEKVKEMEILLACTQQG
jgi:regulator of sirC expression with transglutaminase-like and TPR domain